MSLSASLLLSLILASNFSSWVVLHAEADAQGSLRSLETRHGVNPFLDIAISNVNAWLLPPARNPQPADSRVTIVFLFRPRDFFSAPPVQLSPSFKVHGDRGAFPLELSDPGYPLNSVGEGTVVIELQIARTGAVDNVRVVSDAVGLSAHTEKAVRSWKFEPAMRNGSPTAGIVIVVASYLRPTLYNAAPSTNGPDVPAPPVVVPPPATVFRDSRPITTSPF